MNLDNSSLDHQKNWSWVDRVFAYSFYPISLFFAITSYFYFVSRGLQAPIALLVCEIPILIFIIIFERLIPNRKEWNKAQNDVYTDLGHNILYYSVFALSPLLTAFVASGLFWLTGPSLSPQQLAIWPHNWPLLLQLVLALLIAEFIAYWIHRAHHSFPILWRLHSIHHSPNRLYWFNTGRFHFLNALIDILTVFVVLYLLGISEVVFMAFLLFTAVNGFFQHSNLKIRIGPLNWIVSSAELHRWHHSDILEESNHNYGQNLILWDIIFGTRYLPKDKQQPRNIGMSYPKIFPNSFTKQQLAPFVWRKLLANQSDQT